MSIVPWFVASRGDLYRPLFDSDTRNPRDLDLGIQRAICVDGSMNCGTQRRGVSTVSSILTPQAPMIQRQKRFVLTSQSIVAPRNDVYGFFFG